MQDSAAVLSSDAVAARAFAVAELLAPAQAVVAYFAHVALPPRGVERVPLEAAAGRVLAEDAVAREDHPSHARSTMDGFAVASSDGARERRLAGQIRMGHPAARPLRAGEAMRVPTGGALPDGADAVVPQEDAALAGEVLSLREEPQPGEFVTQRAEDIRAGEAVLHAGRRLGGPELGVLATLGIASVPVFLRPRIAILSTGDELIEPAAVPSLGQIRDSNRYAIAAALHALGAEPVHVPRAVDDRGALREAVARALAEFDALVTTGGSSVGAGDLVPEIVRELGPPGVVVHGIRVKPGKPTLLGAVGTKPIIGLPGNPASALMILEAVARPIVLALTGERRARTVELEAVAIEAFVGREGWTWFVPAEVSSRAGRLYAKPLALRSAQTSLLARAGGYATIGEEPARIEAGEPVRISLFSSGGAPIESA